MKNKSVLFIIMFSMILTFVPTVANATTSNGPWAGACSSDGTNCMLNNTYNWPTNGTISNWINSNTSWGGSYQFNGGSGGMGIQINRGIWPWSGNTNTVNSNLPLQINGNTSTTSTWSFANGTITSTGWQNYWEIWTHNSNAINGNNITSDIMIHPDYKDLSGGAYIQDMTDSYGVVWKVYVQYLSNYEIVHYYRASKTSSLTVKLDDFWDFTVQKGWAAATDYVGSITAGLEAADGSGSFTTTDWNVITTTDVFTALSKSGWTASASNQYASLPASQAIDNNVNTRYTSGASMYNGMKYTIDLGSAKTFRKLHVLTTNINYPRAFKFLVSDNGSSWTQVTTASGSPHAFEITFAPQTKRYVRIELTQGVPDWLDFYELTLFN
ncbi:discoidin domain-containing protein [Paenibacillus sp. strain BS8-2]